MQIIIQDLLQIVRDYRRKMAAITDPDFHFKPVHTTWSKIEVLGHLTDSAQNNLRRFICGQYEVEPPLIIYDQDFWVDANSYKDADKDGIIQLWALLNERIAVILENMPASNYQKVCNTGKDAAQLHTLEWLAADYVKHLKHHLNQIIPQSFNIIYP